MHQMSLIQFPPHRQRKPWYDSTLRIGHSRFALRLTLRCVLVLCMYYPFRPLDSTFLIQIRSRGSSLREAASRCVPTCRACLDDGGPTLARIVRNFARLTTHCTGYHLYIYLSSSVSLFISTTFCVIIVIKFKELSPLKTCVRFSKFQMHDVTTCSLVPTHSQPWK